MADKSKIVIIKKVKKNHGAAHGGSWKVAYADFVTAMMAFFLLMWLLAMVSPEKRAAISEYFKKFSLFDKNGQSFMEGSPKLLQQQGEDINTPGKDFGKGAGEVSAEDLKERLKKAIEEKLQALKDQVMIDIFEGGVRIQIVDTDGNPMFHSGSAQPSEKATQILKLVSENIKDTLNRIAVEGHTDASPLRAGQVTNWELSTSRASSARRELEANGIDPKRIARVVGYADTEPLFTSNPNDPRNRRISIILLQQKMAPVRAAEIKPGPLTNAVSAPAGQVRIKSEQPSPAINHESRMKTVLPVRPSEQPQKAAIEKSAGKQEQKKETINPIKNKSLMDISKPTIAPDIRKER